MLRFSSSVFAAALLAMSVPASAGTIAADGQQLAQQADEWSSASKRKRAVAVYRDYEYPAYGYRWYGWRGADPSFDQYGRPYRNPFPGQCMIDLGYGRWESCSQVR